MGTIPSGEYKFSKHNHADDAESHTDGGYFATIIQHKPEHASGSEAKFGDNHDSSAGAPALARLRTPANGSRVPRSTDKRNHTQLNRPAPDVRRRLRR